MTAYYNEIDEEAADVLRELIHDDVIAFGDVDTRSIKDVHPDDLRGYDQCHFFAGGGLWSVAARLAGWSDDRPLWTGSCPCQPFSSAGKGLGTDDPRHLWPDFHRLICACRPAVVMGEQVAGSAGYGWFDGVRSDLESEGYAARGIDIPACSVDAPHQRNRLYWIALGDGDSTRTHVNAAAGGSRAATCEPDGVLLGHTESERWSKGRAKHEFWLGRRASSDADVQLQSNADSSGREWRAEGAVRNPKWGTSAQRPHARNGSWWADAEWVVSPLDGKARRTKPGLPFLVDGLPGRVGLWRIAGNAISPILAAEVIGALMDVVEPA